MLTLVENQAIKSTTSFRLKCAPLTSGAEVVDAVQDGKIAAATILKSFGVEI